MPPPQEPAFVWFAGTAGVYDESYTLLQEAENTVSNTVWLKSRVPLQLKLGRVQHYKKAGRLAAKIQAKKCMEKWKVTKYQNHTLLNTNFKHVLEVNLNMYWYIEFLHCSQTYGPFLAANYITHRIFRGARPRSEFWELPTGYSFRC